jgi:hypothetical protein
VTPVEIVFDMQCRVMDSPHGTNRKGDNMQEGKVWKNIR